MSEGDGVKSNVRVKNTEAALLKLSANTNKGRVLRKSGQKNAFLLASEMGVNILSTCQWCLGHTLNSPENAP